MPLDDLASNWRITDMPINIQRVRDNLYCLTNFSLNCQRVYTCLISIWYIINRLPLLGIFMLIFIINWLKNSQYSSSSNYLNFRTWQTNYITWPQPLLWVVTKIWTLLPYTKLIRLLTASERFCVNTQWNFFLYMSF